MVGDDGSSTSKRKETDKCQNLSRYRLAWLVEGEYDFRAGDALGRFPSPAQACPTSHSSKWFPIRSGGGGGMVVVVWCGRVERWGWGWVVPWELLS